MKNEDKVKELLKKETDITKKDFIWSLVITELMTNSNNEKKNSNIIFGFLITVLIISWLISTIAIIKMLL